MSDETAKASDAVSSGEEKDITPDGATTSPIEDDTLKSDPNVDSSLISSTDMDNGEEENTTDSEPTADELCKGLEVAAGYLRNDPAMTKVATTFERMAADYRESHETELEDPQFPAQGEPPTHNLTH